MDRRNFIKKGIYIATVPSLVSSVNCNSNTQSITKNQRKDYTNVQWLFREGEVLTPEINRDNPKKLEELAFTSRKPGERELTEWEITSLAKLVPIKRSIEKHSSHYSIHPMWATMFFTLESSLKPTDHNKLSNDFGLGQIKKRSEKLAKKLGTNSNNRLYSPDLRKEKNIFDPETNIIMAMLLHRYNIETHNLKNSDQTYAVYVRGIPSLNPDGSLKPITQERLDAFHQRDDYYQNIIPSFKLSKKEALNLRNKDTLKLLEIYHSNSSVTETYKQELDYFLNDLEQNTKGDARSVLVYDDCFTFASTLQEAGINQTSNYNRLLKLEEKLSELVQNPDLKNRINTTTDLLTEKMNG